VPERLIRLSSKPVEILPFKIIAQHAKNIYKKTKKKLEKRKRRRYSYDKTRLFHHLLSRTPHHPPPKEGAGGRGRGRVWLSKRICSLDIFLLSLSSNSRRPKLVGVRRRRKEILAWSLDEGEGRGDS
jgi:hypothetical protein